MPIARCGIRAAVFTRGARAKLVRQNVPRTVSAVRGAALTKDARVLVSYPLASLWTPGFCCKHAHTEDANTRGDYLHTTAIRKTIDHLSHSTHTEIVATYFAYGSK